MLSEFSLVSVRKTRIEELAKRKNNSAKMVLSALNNLPTYISATQFGITLSSLALGWLGEPALAHVFGIFLEPHLPTHLLFISSHAIAIMLSFIFITFLQIIFGELAPKTTALQKPERFAFVVIAPLMIFTTIFRPFVWILSLSAGLLLRLIGVSPSITRPVHTEDEIKLILAQSAKGGEIDEQEVDIINRVFRLGDLPISTIMVPKKHVIAFEGKTGVQEIAKKITQENLHTRFPIYDKVRDAIIGYVAVTDVYVLAKALHTDIAISQTDLLRKTLHIHEEKRIDDVLSLMKKSGVHLGIVVNSKNSMIGIVSVEDIIESLVGELQENQA